MLTSWKRPHNQSATVSATSFRHATSLASAVLAFSLGTIMLDMLRRPEVPEPDIALCLGATVVLPLAGMIILDVSWWECGFLALLLSTPAALCPHFSISVRFSFVLFVVPFNTSLVYILEYNKRRDFLFGWNSGAASGSFAKSSSATGGGTGNGLQPWGSADESQIHDFLKDLAWDMEDQTVIDASPPEEDTQDEDTSDNALEESAVSSQDSSTLDEQTTTSVQLQNASPVSLGITSPEKSNEDSEDLKLPANDTWEETMHDLCVFHSA